MENAVKMARLLEFKLAFPEEEPLPPEEYLKGGSREVILNAAAFFLGFKSLNSKYTDSRDFLSMFFSVENDAFANRVHRRIVANEIEGSKIIVVNSYSSLRLFENFLSRTEEPQTQSKAEFERNLFKAYLAFNSEFAKSQMVAFESTEHLDGEFKFSMMMFCMHYPISDKTNYDIGEIWITQMVKAIYLFEYLDAAPKTRGLLAAFLAYFDCATWQEYLKRLLPLTMAAVKNEHEAHTDITVSTGPDFESNCGFIERLIVKDQDELDNNDFITTRARPFYKIGAGTYRIIFNLFVVEKIFKGVYFLLRDVNNKLTADKKISGLKGIYGYEFSEKILVYRILELIYPEKCPKFSGQQLADLKIDGAPDFYIRKGENILLFESKDFLIRADLKASFDFDIYDEEFAKTLYYEAQPNGKEKAGAVMQLIGSIKKILRTNFPPDQDYRYKDVFIYPILITHDHQYDVTGFNDLINSWFQDELAILASEGYFVHHVKPLVAVNIDSLIYHQVGLAKKLRLHDVLELYQQHLRITSSPKFPSSENYEKSLMDRTIPFSLFIDKYFSSIGLKQKPPILDIVSPALFNYEHLE